MLKWLHSNIVPNENKTISETEPTELAQQAINKFDEEKLKGKDIQDVKDGNILKDEINPIKEYNKRVGPEGQQVELWGNKDHNTIQGQFINPGGDITDNIVSSKTPESVRDRESYYDDFGPLNCTDSCHQEESLAGSSFEAPSASNSPRPVNASNSPIPVNASHSPHLEQVDSPKSISSNNKEELSEKNSSSCSISEASNSLSKDLPSISRKRKRDESDDDNGQGSSKHRVMEDTIQDTGPDIYEMAGDD